MDLVALLCARRKASVWFMSANVTSETKLEPVRMNKERDKLIKNYTGVCLT